MALKQEFRKGREVNVIHQPRLDTVLMVEDTIRKHSGEFKKFQLWRRLPKSTMYQTFQKIQ